MILVSFKVSCVKNVLKVAIMYQVLSKPFFKLRESIHLYPRVFFLVGHDKMIRFMYGMNRIRLI